VNGGYLFILRTPWQYEKATARCLRLFLILTVAPGKMPEKSVFPFIVPAKALEEKHRSGGSEPFSEGVSHGSGYEETPFSFLETGFLMVPPEGNAPPEPGPVLLLG
jgi:hypothetical protein